MAAEVRGHDDHGVAEVDRPALAVGQSAVVEDLEQDVEDVPVGLLDLVEQDDRIGPPADGLGEPAAFLVADVAGRGADQAGDVVPLAELAHVEPDDGGLAVEEELGEGLGQLGLADAGRAEEEERADRPVRVLQPGPAPSDGVGHGLDGLVLADHPEVDLVLQLDELVALGREHLRHRDAGPLADDLGDLLGVDLFLEEPPAVLGRGLAQGLDLRDLRFQPLPLASLAASA